MQPHLRLLGATRDSAISLTLALAFALSGCGGSNGPNYAPPIPLQVKGLNSGATLVVKDSLGDQLTVSSSGNASFLVKAAPGVAYTLSIATQPKGEFCNVQNASGTLGAATTASVTVACAQVLSGGSGSVSATGGSFTSPAADVTVPVGAAIQDENITVSTVAPPAGLPNNSTPIGASVDIAIDQPTQLNAPLIINIRYDASIVANEANLAVLHYDTSSNHWEPVRILAQDTTAHQFTIVSRVFSPFQVVGFDPTKIPPSHMVSNFTPQVNGWNIVNFGENPNDPNVGSYFTPDGNCFGMAAYAIWYFANGTDGLNGKFSATGNPSVAQILAIRAHLAQSQYWLNEDKTYLGSLGDAQTGQLIQFYLSAFDQPLSFEMVGKYVAPGQTYDASTDYRAHSTVVYGYDSTQFYFYDPNNLNITNTVPFNGKSFGNYAVKETGTGALLEFTDFFYDSVPSLGRSEDFRELTNEAESGFTLTPDISLTSPDSSKTYTDPLIPLTGTLSTTLDPRTSMIAYVPGDAVPLQVASSPGPFNVQMTPPIGTSSIILLAGIKLKPGENFGDTSLWYPNSAADIFNVTLQTQMGIVPESSMLAPGTTQSFQAFPGGKPPTNGNYSYLWTLSGVGSIGSSTTVSTPATPNGNGALTYTAPATPGLATLSVVLINNADNSPLTLPASSAITVTGSTVNVILTTPWTDTGISVTAGQALNITTTGTMDYWTGGCPSTQSCIVTPNGLPWSTCEGSTAGPYSDPGLPCFSLVGRIGLNGMPFEVGSSYNSQVPAGTSGELYLGVNDNYYPDNTGSWTATIY